MLFRSSLDEALPALADEDFLNAAIAFRDPPGEFDPTGRSSQRARAGLKLHLGLVEEAQVQFQHALAWSERERCPVEAGRCLQGLAEIAERRGNAGEAMRLLDHAGELFRQHGAKLYLDRVISRKLQLQGAGTIDTRTSIGAVAAYVQTEQPDLRPHAAPDGTVTILFTDIEDSVALTERLGDQRWLTLLREHNALVREQVRGHDGFEVKAQGDGFMVAFRSARQGLQCAIAIQRAIDERNRPADEPVRVRIGLHTGEVIREAGDFYGQHVNLASRIADQAQGGRILTSALLKELVDSAGEFLFVRGRDVELKGLTGSQRVYEVDWHHSA